MSEKEEKLSYLMSLGHWQVSLEMGNKSISAVYMGKYKQHLLFETSKLYGKNEIVGQTMDFKIFLPSFLISGCGECSKITECEGLRNELVVRFMLSPEKLRIRQQRCFKRLPVLEKGKLVLEHQTAHVIVKDISLQGIGLFTIERIRGESGTLTLLKNGLDLSVEKVHEFTDFNLFQYGMKLVPEQNTEQLKTYLLSLHDQITKMDFVL